MKASIPRFVKKSLEMLRRDANEIRKENGEEELENVVWCYDLC